MKRTTVLQIVWLSAFVSMSCSQAALRTVDGGAGAPAARTGGAGAASTLGGWGGAATSSAGAPSVTPAGSGGVPSSAGASAGSGGNAVSAGSAGMLSAAAGGHTGGAGSGTAGAGSGTAGAGSGTGGTAGSGGSGTGTAGVGGTTAGGVVPGLQGFYWEATCAGSIAVTGHNCPMSDALATCPAGGIDRVQTIPVLGVTGQLYTIYIEVRGVVGTRCYTGGKRASVATASEMGDNNWWYEGGVYANPTGWFNSFELHVSPATGAASGDVYYFNNSDVQGGNYCERDATFLINYQANFKAIGGGTLTFKIHDHDCRAEQNCGKDTDPSSPCTPRTANLAGMAAQPPASFTQPPSNLSYKPQWMFIAVTSVTSP